MGEKCDQLKSGAYKRSVLRGTLLRYTRCALYHSESRAICSSMPR